MKTKWLFCIASILATCCMTRGEGAVVMLGGPGVALSYHQPVHAVIVDPNGNSYQQTVYYDPAIGGVDLNSSWAGPNASVYFPELGAGYVWYNGFWVDHAGYYWNGKQRAYIEHPYWRDHWAGYWNAHGGWNDGWHAGWHYQPEVSVHIHETIHEHGHYHHH